MKNLPCRRALAMAILVALAAPLTAQELQDPPADNSALQLDAVTVTAQRREEQSQKTPMTLTVISGILAAILVGIRKLWEKFRDRK